jgi:hypothetical protein
MRRGLAGLYTLPSPARAAGGLGLICFVLAFVGVNPSVGASFVDAFAKPEEGWLLEFPTGELRRR